MFHFTHTLPHPHTQVEARLRQLEGRTLASAGGAGLKAKAQPTKYDSSRPDGAALAARPAGYDDAGDVAAAKKDKKEKKDKKRKGEET